MNFIFLTQQSVWIPSGAVVTDGLDSGRGMEKQCVVVEDRATGAQHRCRVFFSSQDNRLSDSYCSCETKVRVHLMLFSHVLQIQ